jgi:hypothetical protein
MYRSLPFGGVLLLAMALAFLVVRRLVLDRRAQASNYGTVATNPRLSSPVHLARFPLHRQVHTYSCGPATISMVLSYLEAPLTEEEYSARAGLSERKEGMLPRVFLHHLQNALPSRTVGLVSDESPLDVLLMLHSQLAAGMPVPIYFSTVNAWDARTSDTHYSAVTGMDLARGTIHIANVYGFEEDVPLSDFFARLSFSNHRTEPLGHRLARLMGCIAKNNLYMISPTPRGSPVRGGRLPTLRRYARR